MYFYGSSIVPYVEDKVLLEKGFPRMQEILFSFFIYYLRRFTTLYASSKVVLISSSFSDLLTKLTLHILYNNDYYFILCLYLSQSLILKGLKFYKNIFLPLFFVSVSYVGTEVVRLKVCYFLQQLFTFQPLKCYPFR